MDILNTYKKVGKPYNLADTRHINFPQNLEKGMLL